MYIKFEELDNDNLFVSSYVALFAVSSHRVSIKLSLKDAWRGFGHITLQKPNYHLQGR